MKTFDTILYETPAEHVARIVLNPPETRNAQDTRLLYDLNEAFNVAAQDDQVKVIILAAKGPHFSAGHDLRERDTYQHMSEHKTVGTWCGFTCAGAEAQMAREKEIYIGFSERWRNIPKPTIAAVQGRCVAGGLMLIWPCDIIIAGDDAEFCDPVVSFGIGGVEFFAHPWELGPRRPRSSSSPRTGCPPRRRRASAWSIRSCRGTPSRRRRARWRRRSRRSRSLR